MDNAASQASLLYLKAVQSYKTGEYSITEYLDALENPAVLGHEDACLQYIETMTRIAAGYAPGGIYRWNENKEKNKERAQLTDMFAIDSHKMTVLNALVKAGYYYNKTATMLFDEREEINKFLDLIINEDGSGFTEYEKAICRYQKWVVNNIGDAYDFDVDALDVMEPLINFIKSPQANIVSHDYLLCRDFVKLALIIIKTSSQSMPSWGETEYQENYKDIDVERINVASNLIILRNIKTKEEYKLKPGTRYKIGRAETADIVVPEPSVSGLHAQLEIIDGEIYLEDLNSINGTFINEKKINAGKRIKISLEDELRIANTSFGFDVEY